MRLSVSAVQTVGTVSNLSQTGGRYQPVATAGTSFTTVSYTLNSVTIPFRTHVGTPTHNIGVRAA